MNQLPLHQEHERHHATFGEFAGYAMPLYYDKPLAEHRAVRERAGVFDISHMGQFTAKGERAEDYLQFALTNDVRGMADGEALYSPICQEDGGVLDDLIVYRLSAAEYRIIVNAGNRAQDFAWLAGLAQGFQVGVTDLTDDQCLLAVQGPQAFDLLRGHLQPAPDSLGYYHFVEGTAFGLPVFMARTGYTGEPGCELSVAREAAPLLWQKLTGQLAMTPIGLAARDTLRLEACMALYGHELRAEWHPLESGLAWAVKLEKAEDFMGKQALLKISRQGSAHALVGLRLVERGVARAGYPVLQDGRLVGEVTSGGLSPTLGVALALAHVEREVAKRGAPLAVEIRGRSVAAEVTARPFYKNPALRQ